MKSKGLSLLEVLVTISLVAIVTGAAIPFAHATIDRSRTGAAARYVAARMAHARFEAVKRSASVAIRFTGGTEGYRMQAYLDGNGNGVLMRDIASSIDWPVSSAEKLEHHFPGVAFGIEPNVISLDSTQVLDTADPIHIGASTLLSFSPSGSSSSGTLFVRGRRNSQFAVRILGATGRVRLFQFNFEERTWRRR